MPGMDGTGPFGTGPIGRGLGPCGGGFAFQRGGRIGMGRGGFRQGIGYGRFIPWTISPEEQKNALELQRSWLKARLEEIEKQLESLNQSGS